MNLAWLVAVLRPYDIAPHPNFRDAEYDANPFAQLAGLVSGDPTRLYNSPIGADELSAQDTSIRSVELSLTTAGIQEGLLALTEEVLHGNESGDHARRCALGLLACCAAAELENYSVCDQILDKLLADTEFVEPEGRLIRAVLLQQRSLRFRDTGRGFIAQAAETWELLDGIREATFHEFPMSPGAAVTPHESVREIITSLRHAAWSLVPARFFGDKPAGLPSNFPTWQEMVRTPRSSQAYRIDQLRATEYSKLVRDSYNQMFRSQSRTLGGRGEPTLFFTSLNLELLGDASVYELRRENALMKLVQQVSSPQADVREVSDALRLLRHANKAKSELDLAVETIRAAGPLEALLRDASQILQNRAEPRMLRESELRVLRGAADLMTKNESEIALDLLLEVIEAGGAQPRPGSTQLDIVRLEPAWNTASVLARVAGKDDQISILLLEEARLGRKDDELRDKAIGRSLRQLDWENISLESQAQWVAFLEEYPSLLPASRSVVERLSKQPFTRDRKELHGLDDVADRVNEAMAGRPMAAAELSRAVEIVEESLAGIRNSATRGSFGLRAIDPADVAAAMIIHASALNLWGDLADLLLDSNVQRSDKSSALDRLAFSSVALPPEIEEAFRRDSGNLLASPGFYFDDDDVVRPFPPALRFLAAHRILDEPEVFSLIAQMSGSAEPNAREQASRTVAALAPSLTTPWLLAQSMQLSHDRDPRVRAHAARALSVFSSSESEFKESAERRLMELLDGEGIIAPLLVIRQMRQVDALSDSARRAVGDLAEHHQSATVRREAKALLDPLQ